MIERIAWFDRRFPDRPELGTFPMLVERLRGTPPRIRAKLDELPREILTERLENTWSIQENLGHLYDLETLWEGRLDDLLSGEEELRPADLSNRATDEANHNATPIEELFAAFRDRRGAFVQRLDSLDVEAVALVARHPRLDEPMRTIDLIRFVAEHDDQHLARMAEIARQLGTDHR